MRTGRWPCEARAALRSRSEKIGAQSALSRGFLIPTNLSENGPRSLNGSVPVKLTWNLRTLGPFSVCKFLDRSAMLRRPHRIGSSPADRRLRKVQPFPRHPTSSATLPQKERAYRVQPRGTERRVRSRLLRVSGSAPIEPAMPVWKAEPGRSGAGLVRNTDIVRNPDESRRAPRTLSRGAPRAAEPDRRAGADPNAFFRGV
jgi:hypothetical protein